MRPIRNIAVPASGASVVIPLDPYQKGPVSVQLQGVTNSPDIDVQWTNDDIWAPGFDASNAAWNLVATPQAMAAKGDGGTLCDADGNWMNPLAIRFINNAASSSAVASVLQAGISG